MKAKTPTGSSLERWLRVNSYSDWEVGLTAMPEQPSTLGFITSF